MRKIFETVVGLSSLFVAFSAGPAFGEMIGEVIVGDVVAVKRVFKMDFNDCMRSYSAGSCTVKFGPRYPKFEMVVSQGETYNFGGRTVYVIPIATGYMIQVLHGYEGDQNEVKKVIRHAINALKTIEVVVYTLK